MGLGIGTFLGAGLKVGGAIAGLITGNKAYKESKNMLNKQLSDNQNWYDRRYNEDETQRATAQKAITAMNDAQRSRMARSAGVSAITGASGEAAASEKEAANKAIGQTVSAINAQGDARKDRIESQYRSTKANIDNQRFNLQQDKRAQIQQAVGQMGDVGSTIMAADLGSVWNKDRLKDANGNPTNTPT